eukprot:TRINITY_DN367_c0_g1_i1.p1 TRINITY_DN367_c0_g1~~TRINITY_DN367_c0_g1_i1.p1  ORF type:complete len:450 (+),score=99.76 TRINITY_DN367_c0_g1_i1:35-1384(+)
MFILYYFYKRKHQSLFCALILIWRATSQTIDGVDSLYHQGDPFSCWTEQVPTQGLYFCESSQNGEAPPISPQSSVTLYALGLHGDLTGMLIQYWLGNVNYTVDMALLVGPANINFHSVDSSYDIWKGTIPATPGTQMVSYQIIAVDTSDHVYLKLRNGLGNLLGQNYERLYSPGDYFYNISSPTTTNPIPAPKQPNPVTNPTPIPTPFTNPTPIPAPKQPNPVTNPTPILAPKPIPVTTPIAIPSQWKDIKGFPVFYLNDQKFVEITNCELKIIGNAYLISLNLIDSMVIFNGTLSIMSGDLLISNSELVVKGSMEFKDSVITLSTVSHISGEESIQISNITLVVAVNDRYDSRELISFSSSSNVDLSSISLVVTNTSHPNCYHLEKRISKSTMVLVLIADSCSSSNLTLIGGIVGGVLAFVIITIMLVVYLRDRKKYNQQFKSLAIVK